MSTLVADRIASFNDFDFDTSGNQGFLYVHNEPTSHVDPSGLIDIAYEGPIHPKPPQKPQPSPPAATKPVPTAPAISPAQARLDYLVELIIELIKIGDDIDAGRTTNCTLNGTLNKKEWKVLREKMRYAIQYYNTLETVSLHNGSSINLPGLPGITLDQTAFFGPDYGALEVYIHEPLHDGWQYGADGFAHNNINVIIGPYSGMNNYFGNFINLIQGSSYNDGSGKISLWGLARQNAQACVSTRK